MKFRLIVFFAGWWLMTGLGCAQAVDTSVWEGRANLLKNSFGTYCAAPRLENGRVDAERLTAELTNLHANTYNFCIMVATDWDDLKLFLPVAREHGIRVWASLLPPSESPPHTKHFSEPYRMDYDRWAQEFAKLSLQETNLVAWSIDDFTYNLKLFTPERLAKMLGGARQINGRLAFVPCCYYKPLTPEFVTNYVPIIDGILFPYRHDSTGGNLTDASLAMPEIKHLKEMTGGSFPIIVDVYATAHSRLGKSTADYVGQVMDAGKDSADGVMIYCHQDPKLNVEKYEVIKRHFSAWAASSK